MTLAMMKATSAQPDNRGPSYQSRLRLLDNRLMKFNIRHADVDKPRIGFSNGASSIANMRASEFAPLIWQMMIVLGVGDEELLLDQGAKHRVVDTMYELLNLRTMLWRPEITEVGLRGIVFNIGMYVLNIVLYCTI